MLVTSQLEVHSMYLIARAGGLLHLSLTAQLSEKAQLDRSL
jgi:hypothetical protein